MSTALPIKDSPVDVGAILREVASRMNVPVMDILCSPGKRVDKFATAARFLSCVCLFRAGLSVSDVSRALHRNHSSILNALDRTKTVLELEESELDKLTESILTCSVRTGASALSTRLDAILAPLPADDARAVRAAIDGAVLGWKLYPGPLIAYGLWLLARGPELRHAVQGALVACEYKGHAGTIERMAVRLGYPVAA